MGGQQRQDAARREAGKTKEKRSFLKQLNRRSGQEHAEIKALSDTIAAFAPVKGTNSMMTVQAAPAGSYAAARMFEELPISTYTKEALAAAKYVRLTAIQRAALPHALAGRDILGAAKTGSGKTLSFLVPLVERLYRLKWTRRDGLGALVLTPTRELALQIFEELKIIGQHHEMSAGLLIGGKDIKAERLSVGSLNVLVATPGRLLQHMDETPGFETNQLQMLVLDEADRILDMGFSQTLDAILSNLPKERQTMLFSATQTKSIKSLARLSLNDPEYLSVHEDADSATPLKLDQAYSVVGLHEKIDMVWSFIKAHLGAKTIVFLSTCKQVRFVHEAFRRLRPGVPIRALHGGMKQMKRMGVFYEFCEAKKGDGMVLFATDIAARGLDFPTIDWVLQMDCPEDSAAYIHRVGRTARYMSSGRALLLLTPSEAPGMLEALADAKVPIKQIKVNPKKAASVGPALQALLSKSVELKEFAQRALIAYVRSVFLQECGTEGAEGDCAERTLITHVRSVFLQPNKKVFDVAAMPIVDFALSLGLPTAPKLRFLKRTGKKVTAIEVGGSGGGALVDQGGLADDGGDDASDEEGEGAEAEGQQAAAAAGEAGRKRRHADAPAEDGGLEAAAAGRRRAGARAAAGSGAGDDSDGDDFLRVKTRDIFAGSSGGGGGKGGGEERVEPWAAAEALAAQEAIGAREKKKRLKIKEGKNTGSRMVFDEEGTAVEPLALLARGLGEDDVEKVVDADGVYVGVRAKSGDRFKAAAEVLKQRDRDDKARLKAARQELKFAERAQRKAQGGQGGGRDAVMGDGSGSEASEDEGGRGGGARVTLGGHGSDSDGGEAGSSGSDGGGGSDGAESDDSRGGVAPLYRELAKKKQQGGPAAGGEAAASSARTGRGGKRSGGGGGGALSLAGQEALALRLLSSKK
ncbi:hypothetical protein FOA52_006245 [Chlamydomonas sp. UWO 241]|nr:hypothetical protein FOA52_006245 [Chlamydomonas sp. UWO 241]